MGNFFKKLISPSEDVSTKRLITLIAFLLMVIGFISNLFFKLTIDADIYDSMKWIVIGGLGFVASERFTGTSFSQRNPSDIDSSSSSTTEAQPYPPVK